LHTCIESSCFHSARFHSSHSGDFFSSLRWKCDALDVRSFPRTAAATVAMVGLSTASITTKGWKLKVLWTDESYDWLPLSQVKESNLIECAEYAIAQGIHKEPAFNWWVPHVIRKRDRLINKVVHRTCKSNMKFGIVIPRTVDEAYELVRKSGNSFWRDSIKKEMDSVNAYNTFHVMDDDERMPPGFQEITCHMVFTVKFDLRRKSRYVAGNHLVKDQPSYNTYSSVVSRESVRIGFLLAALNDLDLMSGDISNAYLNTTTKENIWFRAGTKFGNQKGQRVKIVKALWITWIG